MIGLSQYRRAAFHPRLNLGPDARYGAHLPAGVFASAGPIVGGNTGRRANGSKINNALIQAGLRIGAFLKSDLPKASPDNVGAFPEKSSAR